MVNDLCNHGDAASMGSGFEEDVPEGRRTRRRLRRRRMQGDVVALREPRLVSEDVGETDMRCLLMVTEHRARNV